MSSTFAPSQPVVLASDSVGGTLVAQDGIVYYLTDCCKASGKGGQHGVICRSCYRPVSDVYGMGWMASDEQAWLNYAEMLRPSIERFADKMANSTKLRAQSL